MDKRQQTTIIDMEERIKSWAKLAPGEFNYSMVDKELEISGCDFKNVRTIALESLVVQGILDRVGSKRGWYRPAQKELESINVLDADETPVNIFLPFAMHKWVYLLPGNIVTIGGVKNSGKTGLLLNLAYDNRDNFDVHYFNSEMGPGEIKLRCRKYSESNKVPFWEWQKVKFYERSSDFSDVIFPGKQSLNIIDFYECHDEFYKMGEGIRKVHDKLNGAICFFAIQKNPGNNDPVGGRRVTEKSRIHLSIDYNYGQRYPHRLKIDVGKNWASDTNPNGLYVDYKLAQGCYMKPDDSLNPPNIWNKEK